MMPDETESTFDASDPAMIARYEPYLRMLARSQARKAYQAKVGASDMVQQVMLQAVQGFDKFRGQTEGELRAWLRQILANHLCHLDRDMHRDKRDVSREHSMQQAMTQSSMRLEQFLAGNAATPSQHVAISEHVLKMAAAIERLPETQRDAIRLHYLDGMKLSEVAQRMSKSTGSIAGLLHRGMKQLKQELAES